MLNYDLFGKDCHVSMKMSPDYIHKDFSKSSGSLNQALVNKLQREEVGKIRFRHWEVEAKSRGLGIDLAVFWKEELAASSLIPVLLHHFPMPKHFCSCLSCMVILFDMRIHQVDCTELFKTSLRRLWAGRGGADEMASHAVGKKFECMVFIETRQRERDIWKIHVRAEERE